MVSMLKDTHDIDDINKSFTNLSTTQDSTDRLGILKNVHKSINIKLLLNQILNCDPNDFVSNLRINGAGMIRLTLFENNHGAIHYHVFNNNLFNLTPAGYFDNELPHIHNFQAYSHLLHGQLFEKRYHLYPLNDTEYKEYMTFITYLESLDKNNRSFLISVLNEHSLNNKTIQFQGQTIDLGKAQLYYTVFNNKKDENKDGFHQFFFEDGYAKAETLPSRIICEGETYELPAEIAHCIQSSNQATTLFFTDTTYSPVPVSVGHQKSVSTFAKGHLQKYSKDQAPTKNRLFLGEEINKQLIKLLFENTQKAIGVLGK